VSVVDDAIAASPEPSRDRLNQILAALREEIPGAEEVISYGIPTFDRNGRHVLHFAGFPNHVGLYPTPHGVEAFEAELSEYPRGKGSVQLPHDRPLPLDLIRRIARYRAAEEAAKKPKNPRTK
jgi:uncharacterized protein YdhG (YjbR/CyaY superfamily)